MDNLIQEYRKDQYHITTDTAKVDVVAVHDFLSQCYWAEGIAKAVVETSIRNSLCFSLFDETTQIGFARVITDYATYGYLADVYILQSYRGRGLSKWLMSCICSHPELQGFRRWSLLTRDAHGLYRKFGFASVKHPERYMEIHKPYSHQK